MDAQARWQELMDCSEEAIPLDEASLLIAAHADPGLDVAAELTRLDEIAAQVGAPDTDDVCRVLFRQLGLRGDRETYDDPRNSYVNQVLDRRLGIPISLSVLLIEVGSRCGLTLQGVGMPGHFLVRDEASPQLLIDAFAGGERLDASGCQRLLRTVAGRPVDLVPSMLATTGRRAILARMLANLDRSFDRRNDRRSLRWVSRLRRTIPGLPVGDRVEIASRLAGLGCFDDAADVLSELAETQLSPGMTDHLQAKAAALRARLN